MQPQVDSGNSRDFVDACTDSRINAQETSGATAHLVKDTVCQALEPHHSYFTFQVRNLVLARVVVVWAAELYEPPTPPPPSAPPPVPPPP